jgi:hypothetical protein
MLCLKIPQKTCFRIIILTGDTQFTLVGMNLKICFESTKKGEIGYIGQVWEGGYKNEKWIPIRLMNGGELWHNEVLRAFGSTFESSVDL